jgi:hypothetical protein
LEVVSRPIKIQLSHSELKFATTGSGVPPTSITCLLNNDMTATSALSIVDESKNEVTTSNGKYGTFSVLDGNGTATPNLTNLFKQSGGLTIDSYTGSISGTPNG